MPSLLTRNEKLVIIPTYDEKDNVTPLCEQILEVCADVDILFIDDNSPDGTGKVLDGLAEKYPNVKVMHRPGKLGVGGAHLDGIHYAYAQGYTHLISMDCDFTHDPKDIPNLLFYANSRLGYTVVVGTRHVFDSSLAGWSSWRKMVTHFGHFMTTLLLGMEYDATGAFRVYWLKNLPERLFNLVTSKDYAFFFESLAILNANGVRIFEVAITLSPRSLGSSKLKTRDLIHAFLFMMHLSYKLHFRKDELVR